MLSLLVTLIEASPRASSTITTDVSGIMPSAQASGAQFISQKQKTLMARAGVR